MKPLPNNRVSSPLMAIRAFTLAEMLISIGIFSMVVAAVVYTQIFGLRMYTLAATKLSATKDGRQAMNVIRETIREAKTLQVGNCTGGDPTSFTSIPTSSNAQGNALLIYPTTNTSPYTIFFLDTSTPTNKLTEYGVTLNYSGTNVTGSNVSSLVLASYITNTTIFSAEDYQGNVLTNNPRNNRVYEVRLQFYQWEYPIAAVGPSNMYDFYQLRTRATRRAID